MQSFYIVHRTCISKEWNNEGITKVSSLRVTRTCIGKSLPCFCCLKLSHARNRVQEAMSAGGTSRGAEREGGPLRGRRGSERIQKQLPSTAGANGMSRSALCDIAQPAAFCLRATLTRLLITRQNLALVECVGRRGLLRDTLEGYFGRYVAKHVLRSMLSI